MMYGCVTAVDLYIRCTFSEAHFFLDFENQFYATKDSQKGPTLFRSVYAECEEAVACFVPRVTDVSTCIAIYFCLGENAEAYFRIPPSGKCVLLGHVCEVRTPPKFDRFGSLVPCTRSAFKNLLGQCVRLLFRLGCLSRRPESNWILDSKGCLSAPDRLEAPRNRKRNIPV